jgi:hypothetical protein
MIDKYNLKNHETNCTKESISIYNELRPSYSNFMLTPKPCIQSQIKMRTYKTKAACQKQFLQKCFN